MSLNINYPITDRLARDKNITAQINDMLTRSAVGRTVAPKKGNMGFVGYADIASKYISVIQAAI